MQATRNYGRTDQRRNLYDRERCRRCGYLRINVVHERDPEHAPEGAAYYRDKVPDLHEFLPSGLYAP